ncbi:NUDIX hydrolase [Wenjunlia vitaminophila]|uniref:NUDIX hydrolase n=1 Tax=Wenjunlia vitaminophila TaxID=76728 RepID=A0A0T6LSB4_WENVI|nr:NUDIX domain-containing protein [Wenjunlia vitaminophila]KRV48706.1 NUDIX hydrolase [Wenjunlia vitaminophila]
MATPDFVRELRTQVGSQLLFLPGVTALVFDDRGRLLLNRRSDTGNWAVLGGIVEPGEQPADAAAREVLEETGVRVAVERLVAVLTSEEVNYPNGDLAQFLSVVFRCRAVSGEARVADDESLEVGWFALDALPKLSERSLAVIACAAGDGPAWFRAPLS